MAVEQTFLMIKPDGVQRRLVGEIITRYERKGWNLVAMKFLNPSKQLVEEHYAEHKGKPFLPGLVKYMTSGMCVAMVWEGSGIIAESRRLNGATKPFEAATGTIRGDFCCETGRNMIHGSDGAEAAKREIALWFKTEEIFKVEACDQKWITE